MKILIYLVVIAVVVGVVVVLLGRGDYNKLPLPEGAALNEDDMEFVDEGAPVEEAREPFPPTALYNDRGFLVCEYFWNDVRAACPEVKQTKWNSRDPWDINALPEACKMKALGGKDGEFMVNVGRAAGGGAQSADAVFDQGRAGFGTIGFKTIDVAGLGEKAYTVPNPYSDVQSGYNFHVKKGVWLVDITSENPAFCATEAQTKDVVQRILRKLP
ncbi:MAG: hypothetical protein HYT82_01540 [Candidatus Harrisonbacteria bacterium]|nr:hypothetical protein [Candidatus Harrisonbacteria bacterium]MBI2406093.1 hypothetical protein [Candidatus Harrisonbacteria bacterium]